MIMASAGNRNGGGGPSNNLKLADLEAIQAACPDVLAWDPSQMKQMTAQFRDQNRSLLVRGHSERAEEVWGRGVSQGRFFDANDVASSARVALLGYKTAEFLYGGDDPLGKQIQLDGAPYRVIGVLEAKGTDPHGVDRDDEVHVPISTMLRRIRNVDFIAYAKLRVDHADHTEDVGKRAAAILRERHVIRTDQDDDFSVFTPLLVRKMMTGANKVFSLYLPLVALIALLVAAMVIANIMLMAVKERIPEIGLRKAVGATDAQVRRQFLIEAFVVTLCSGIVGIALGLGVLAGISTHLDFTMLISPAAIGLGLAAAVVVGILSGLWPARHAAKLDPVAALR